jgi:hypothetical protein
MQTFFKNSSLLLRRYIEIFIETCLRAGPVHSEKVIRVEVFQNNIFVKGDSIYKTVRRNNGQKYI